jgi:histidine triad (HIT) family protein
VEFEDCIFCRILKGEIPADFVYRNKKVAVFKDIHPKAPVHVLIVPEQHIESIDHLTENDRDIVAEIFMVAKKIASDLGVDGGYRLLFNVGRKGGQLVDHIHLHLMGGWRQENVITEPVLNEAESEEAKHFKEDLTELLK